MRLWKLQDLFDDIHKQMPKAKKHVRLVHVCEECGWRTPEIAPLDISAELTFDIPQTFEIKNHGLCDKCNGKCWQQIRDHAEYTKNNCEYCGGGRCSHYPHELGE